MTSFIDSGYTTRKEYDAAMASGASATMSCPSKPDPMEPVTLYYYFNAGFSGRVEGPMLLLEDAGVPYTCSSEVNEPKVDEAVFAPPACKDSAGYTSQSTAICMHLGVKVGLAGPPEALGRQMRAALNGEE